VGFLGSRLISASKMPSPESNLVQSLLSATPSYFYYGHLAPPGYFSGLLRAIVHLHNNEEIEMRSIRKTELFPQTVARRVGDEKEPDPQPPKEKKIQTPPIVGKVSIEPYHFDVFNFHTS